MWTITNGNVYVHSQIGNDITGDGSMALPFKSMQQALDIAAPGQKVVARGYFNEATVGYGEIIFGDGYFEMNGSGLIGTTYPSAFKNAKSITNCIIKDYVFSIASVNEEYYNCSFIDCNYLAYGTIGAVVRIFKNCYFTNCEIGKQFFAYNIVNNTFINCKNIIFNLTYKFSNNIFDSQCTGIVLPLSTLVISNYNCYENGVTINGLSLASWKTTYSQYDQNSIQPVDAGINDKTDKDYTISPTSPCKGAGEGGVDIGASYKAVSVDGLDPLFDGTPGVNLGGYKDENVQIDGFGHISLSSGTSGSITSDVIDLVAKGLTLPVGIIHLFGDENIDLEDAFDLEAFPNNNFVYEMKFGNSIPNCLNANFKPFLRRNLPTIDSALRGNGDPLFDPNTAVGVSDQFIQIRVTFRTT